MTLPIIRLEVDGMRHSIAHAITEHQAQMAEDIRKAVDAYCTTENLSRVVTAAAEAALHNAIKEEVTHFFKFGNGRKAVAAAVKQSILNKETYTPLDSVE